jgi:hypothetical protein
MEGTGPSLAARRPRARCSTPIPGTHRERRGTPHRADSSRPIPIILISDCTIKRRPYRRRARTVVPAGRAGAGAPSTNGRLRSGQLHGRPILGVISARLLGRITSIGGADVVIRGGVLAVGPYCSYGYSGADVGTEGDGAGSGSIPAGAGGDLIELGALPGPSGR